jgi:hypothetical protein
MPKETPQQIDADLRVAMALNFELNHAPRDENTPPASSAPQAADGRVRSAAEIEDDVYIMGFILGGHRPAGSTNPSARSSNESAPPAPPEQPPNGGGGSSSSGSPP